MFATRMLMRAINLLYFVMYIFAAFCRMYVFPFPSFPYLLLLLLLIIITIITIIIIIIILVIVIIY